MLTTLLYIFMTLLLTSLVVKVFRHFFIKLGDINIHRKFIKNTISASIWLVGGLISLSHLPNFTDTAATVIAGSGILAITVGLAAQEPLANAFNGLFISIFKPFEVGDRVHLVNANITGFVEDITLRHTVVRTFVNSRIIIPNSIMSHELIENSNFFNPQASAFIDITITYDSDMALAKELMAQIISAHPDFVDTRTPEQLSSGKAIVPVFVRNLGLHGVELRASMWTSSVDTNFPACSDVRGEIAQAFKLNNIQISSISHLLVSGSLRP